jgi:CelD/BcsL family acetyltransferase involved in cellulose biosynthesis/ribosomal protein S18 acetylase RimI-like enzyme
MTPATLPTAGAAGATSARVISDLQTLERELANGLHDAWRELAERDPHAALFQTPAWCLPWYRCYHDEYDPHVLIVSTHQELVGVVPLAVRRGTRELGFASGPVPDYCDVVAVPEHRRGVLAALVSAYVAGGFRHPLRVGWIDPSSPTPALLLEICEEQRLHRIVRQQPCWKWFPPAPAKPSAHKFLKWYERHGRVAFTVVDTEEAWLRFRGEYYQQHSLRQMMAGRQLAFADPRRRAFYEHLFHSPELRTLVTAFEVDGRMVAGHFGYLWRGMLLLGPPAIRLRDEQRSPAVILLSWIIQHAAKLGLAGFDLTIGDSEFKARLGNQCVQVATVEIYRQRSAYCVQAARTRLLRTARRTVDWIGGDGTWKKRVKPAGNWLDYKRQRLAEIGVPAAIRMGLGAVARALVERRTGLVYTMTPEQLRPVAPKLKSGETFAVHDGCAEDLLRTSGTEPSLSRILTETARSFARERDDSRTLHTILVNGELAGWGYSYWPTKPAALSETPAAVLEFEPRSVSLYAFHTITAFRGRRLNQALLTHILRSRFAQGAERAYIGVLASNAPSRGAIERVGFRLRRKNEYVRLLTRQSLRSVDVVDG